MFNQDTIKQLQALQVEGQFIELRTLQRLSDGSQVPAGSYFMNGDIEPALAWADEKAKQGIEVFVGVNPRQSKSGKKEDVAIVTALYTDLDLHGQGIDEAVHELLNCELYPNRIVKSGRGLHAYWHIAPSTDKQLWRKTNEAIQRRFAHLKADKAVATDEARILRLVPYPNLKSDAGEVACVWAPDVRFTLEQVAEAFGVIEKQEVQEFGRVNAIRNVTQVLLDRAVREGTPGNRNNAGFWLACQLRDNGFTEDEAAALMIEHCDRTDYAGGSYNHSEALRTLHSAYTREARDAWTAPQQAVKALPQHRTDTGNAELFAQLFGGQVLFNHTAKKWLIWDGVRWSVDNTGKVGRYATDTARAMLRAASEIEDDDKRKQVVAWALSSESLSKRRAMLEIAQELLPVTASQLDSDLLLATVRNGTLDLRAGIVRESRPADMLTKQLGTEHNADADCPRWKQFLSEIFDDNQELISYVQRAVGYSLTGDTREQVLFLLHGSGANGKSTFLEVIAALMGDYASTTSFSAFEETGKDRGGVNNDLAKLNGSRFVTIIESNEDRRLNEAKVKSVTGQDRVEARFLFGEFFEFVPQFKIWFAMNHKPVIRGTDNGIWRRVKLIPFNQNFIGREDKMLKETLLAELPGILNWALEGLLVWHRDGLREPETVTNAVAEYRVESDQIAQWIDEECEVGTGYMISTNAYLAYAAWAKSRGEHVLTQTMWGRRMSDKNFVSKRKSLTGGKKGPTVYEGITLRSDPPAFGKLDK